MPVSGIFLTWDGTAALGWDSGIWQDVENSTALTVLPDDFYLTLINAKIAANHWDGTTEGAYTIWSALLPGINILIQDNCDMTFNLCVQGTVPSPLTIALLTEGYLPLRPEGVLIWECILPVDTNPLFGWDIDITAVQGWDAGSWGSETYTY